MNAIVRLLSRGAAVAISTAATSVASAQTGAPTESSASFRGAGVAADGTIWVSGTDGTVLRSTDNGRHWEPRPIADAEGQDLRDVEAVSATTAYAMVAGFEGARIYKTTDGGENWVRQYEDPKVFLDGISFWDESHGVAIGDPMDGHFVILRTEDGGAHWTPVPARDAPKALPGEAAFAAGGAMITVGPGGRVWIGTGNSDTAGARVFRSADYGRTWQASATPVPAGGGGGIFAVVFRDTLHGVAIGGNFGAVEADRLNVAFTEDGGKTWQRGDTTSATGYMSGATHATLGGKEAFVAVGPVGMFVSVDDGRTWQRFNAEAYHAVAAAAGKAIVASGDGGQVHVWPSLDVARDKSTPAFQRGN